MAQIRDRYRQNVPDVYEQVLHLSDSLFLTPAQVRALQDAQSRFQPYADSVWTALAPYFAALPDRYSASEALNRQEEAIDDVWTLTRAEGPTIRGILSPQQYALPDAWWKAILDGKGRVRMRTFRV